MSAQSSAPGSERDALDTPEGRGMRKHLLWFFVFGLVACSNGGLKTPPIDGAPDGREDSVAPSDDSQRVESPDLPVDMALPDSSVPAERPVIAGRGEVRCGGYTCTSATGPCCPATENLFSPTTCVLNCGLRPAIVCDGPEDCADGLICCSVESASSGFVGASCMDASQCLAPSRVICHQQSDCPARQTCGQPNPGPAAVSPPAGPAEWDVDFLVCQAS
jgi:hypothetical protein